MTWEEVRDLDRSRAVALLPVGAIEAHGPHLPLSTDVVIAEAMAEAAAERLSRAGCSALVLPTLTYTFAGFAAGFPGTVSVRPDTVAATIVEIATSLHRGGISLLGLANAHLDPSHIDALGMAVEAVRESGLMTIVFPDVTKRPWAGRLTEEFRSGACHAGRYEGSIVMARAPELVRDEVRRSLPPNPASLSAAIREGKRTFREAGGPRAYFGAPAEATAEEGESTIQLLGTMLEEAVLAEWDDVG